MLFSKLKLPTIAESAVKYTAANFLNAVVPILLLPFLTSYLSKEDYGLVSLFQVFVMIILPCAGFNGQAAVEREYFNANKEFSTYVSNSIFLVFLSGSFILLIGIIFNQQLSRYTDFPAEYLWVVPVYCIFHNACEILLSVWRLHNKATYYGLFRIGRTLLEVFASIYLVTRLTNGWFGRVEGMLLAAALFAILAIIFLKQMRFLVLKWKTEYVRDILKFGIPLIPHILGGVVMVYSDRLFITKMVGLSETGSYTVGYQVAMAIALLQSSFNLAWVPWFYSKLNLNSATVNRKIVKITYWYCLIILSCALLLTLVSPLIFHIFVNKLYHDSIQFVFWIALGFAFDGMYKMMVNYIFYIKKTYIISLITFLTAILNLGLNYSFILEYGAVGAAKATALCMFFEFIVVWWISNRIFPMPWRLSKMQDTLEAKS